MGFWEGFEKQAAKLTWMGNPLAKLKSVRRAGRIHDVKVMRRMKGDRAKAVAATGPHDRHWKARMEGTYNPRAILDTAAEKKREYDAKYKSQAPLRAVGKGLLGGAGLGYLYSKATAPQQEYHVRR